MLNATATLPCSGRCFLNLIGNALKFTRERPVAKIEIASRKQGDETLFSVRDSCRRGFGYEIRREALRPVRTSAHRDNVKARVLAFPSCNASSSGNNFYTTVYEKAAKSRG